MPTYSYIVRSEDGIRSEGEIQAKNIAEATEKLQKKGNTVVTLDEKDEGWGALGPFIDEMSLAVTRFKNRVPLKILVFFTRQLSTMFDAGLTLEKSLSSLSRDQQHKRFKKTLTKVSSDIKKGLTLSDALKRHPGVFSNLYIALVQAGEVSGGLHTVLGQLADYLEQIQETRRKVLSALYYPAFIVLFLILMLFALFVFIIPMFGEVYAKLGAQLPGPTRALMGVSKTVSENFISVSAIVILVVVGIWMISFTKRGGYIIDRIKLNIPIFGQLLRENALAKLNKTLSILIEAGVPVLDSMSLIKKVVENKVFKRAVTQSSEFIRDGLSISAAFKRSGEFPSTMLQLAATGDETGEIASLLAKSAEFYTKQVDAIVDRLTSLIEPLLIVIVGVVVGTIVVVTYLPVFYLGMALSSGM